MNYCWFNRSALLGLLLLLKISLPVISQQLPLVQIEQLPPLRVAVGQDQQLTLSFIISDGYHIQANQLDDENLIPTILTFKASDQVIVGEPLFPPSAKFRMQGTEEDLLVFGDSLKIKVPIKVHQLGERGEYILVGKLHYQACDSFKCYFPRNIDFTVEIHAE